MRDVSARIDSLMWQYGKLTFPQVCGSGFASVKVSQAAVHLYYDVDFTNDRCRVCALALRALCCAVLCCAVLCCAVLP